MIRRSLSKVLSKLRKPVPSRSDDLFLSEDMGLPAPAPRGGRSLWVSPLTRRILSLNVLALNVLMVGFLFTNPSRDGLVQQRIESLVSQAKLLADFTKVEIRARDIQEPSVEDFKKFLAEIDLRRGLTTVVLDDKSNLVIAIEGDDDPFIPAETRPTPISDFFAKVWGAISTPFVQQEDEGNSLLFPQLVELASGIEGPETILTQELVASRGRVFAVAVPVYQDDEFLAIVTLASAIGEIETLTRLERERVLQMFLIATLISAALSLALAATIGNPIRQLAVAAEVGGERGQRNNRTGRVRIPDLSARPDEIGRLSHAMRSMVAALYDRIDANEQFAADVSHEIKNPLASLRSAVGTMRFAKTEEQQGKLLDVIEHDVKRLDRLVSDISNASRLDSELVKEEEASFDLLHMLKNLTEYLGEDSQQKGVDFITDFPQETLLVQGLEARLAQVFVNLISNAISFCQNGDAIRIWVRQRENRVLVVVEDTGPGIPDQSLTKIFKRFYSHRPDNDFGNNSGLGLAISKQIVEAHGGVIWAENIKPSKADPESDPLGARFVVGLPV